MTIRTLSWPPPLLDANIGVLVATDPGLISSWHDLKARGSISVDYAPALDGTGVDLYIVDRGVTPTAETAGRLTRIYDHVPGEPPNWHPNGVASVAAGTQRGAAPGATIWDASAGNGLTGLAAALDAVAAHAAGRSRPAVCNLSWGTNVTALNARVQTLIDAGIVVIVAAGNDATDVAAGSLAWPASMPDVITAGSTDFTRRQSPTSNFGPLVDVWACGYHAALGDADVGALNYMLDTSFAAALVSGLCCRLLQGQAKLISRTDVLNFRDALRTMAGAPGYDRTGAPLPAPFLHVAQDAVLPPLPALPFWGVFMREGQNTFVRLHEVLFRDSAGASLMAGGIAFKNRAPTASGVVANAVDGDTATAFAMNNCWNASWNVKPFDIDFVLTSPHVVDRIAVYNQRSTGQEITAFTLLRSDDGGITHTEIGAFTTANDWRAAERRDFIPVNAVASDRYRMHVTAGDAWVSLGEVELYAAGAVVSADADISGSTPVNSGVLARINDGDGEPALLFQFATQVTPADVQITIPAATPAQMPAVIALRFWDGAQWIETNEYSGLVWNIAAGETKTFPITPP